MLKQGLLITPRGSTYTIYEVEEPNFYRLDFVTDNADFNIEVDKIVYSIVRRKKTYKYGDDAIYREYSQLVRDIGFQRGKTDTESYWENGKFYQKFKKVDEANGFTQETLTENGTFQSTSVFFNGYTYMMQVVARVYGVKLEPLNFFEYEDVGLVSTNTSKITTPYYPLTLLKAKYDIEHLADYNFKVVHTVEEAREELLLYDTSTYPLRGFDTETTGLDVSMYGTDELVGVILARSDKDSTYFPFRMKEMENLPIEFLSELVEVLNKHGDITTAHNKQFDIQVMLKEGYKIHVKWDTRILSFIINPVLEKGAHALKELIFKMNGKVYLELQNIFVSDKLIDFSILPEDITELYACPDGTNAIQLFEYLLPNLLEDNKKLFEYECELADLKAEQEYYGMRVDLKRYTHQYENCNYIIDQLLKAFRIMTRIDGNVNSSDVIRDLLYNKMHCKVIARTKTGQPSTSSATIDKLASTKADEEHHITQNIVDLDNKVIVKASDLAQAKYPALIILSKYKKYIKLKTAFYARFERTMTTGRVFFWINQNGTASGRQSSPMHQLPSELKDCMLADSDDHRFWGPDYSQVELRMIAYLANEPELIERCRDWHNDIHRAIGSLISNKEMWAITPEERSKGKRRNFGVVYLISKYGLAGQIFGPGYTTENVEFCEHQLDEFYNRFKRIKRYLAINREIVTTKGYMQTAIFHRRRYFKQIFDPDITSRQKASLIRQANNMPVQGTSADLIKIAEVNYSRYIHNKGWDAIMDNGLPRVRAMLSIHDEVILSADKSIPVEEIIKMIRTCMEIELDGAPPFFVQPAYMHNWGEHSDDSVAMPIGLRDDLIDAYDKTGVSKINYDNYIDVLNKYRDNQLEQYMEDLISKYGTDYKILGQHVRHPSLTFDLLDRFHNDIADLGLEHEDNITEACRLYLEKRKGTYVAKEKEATSVVESDSDKFFDEAEALVQFDEYGDVIYTDTDDDEDAVPVSIYDDEKFINAVTDNKLYRVWELADTIFIDMSELLDTDANKIIQEAYKYKDDNGFYNVLFLYAGKTLKPGLKVEDIPVDALSDMIVEMESQYNAQLHA